MKKNEMTWQAMLAEAVGLVAAVVYLGLQIYYGVAYHVSAVQILLNIAVMVLVYAGLTMLGVYPEHVNGLPREICKGDVRRTPCAWCASQSLSLQADFCSQASATRWERSFRLLILWWCSC